MESRGDPGALGDPRDSGFRRFRVVVIRQPRIACRRSMLPADESL
jgi:hypothetical protein